MLIFLRKTFRLNIANSSPRIRPAPQSATAALRLQTYYVSHIEATGLNGVLE